MTEVVSIIDVAQKAGVAKSTVSNVLTGRKYVSDELKKRVLRACEELDYHPNFYASALSSKKSNIIALLLESSDDIDKKMYKNLIVSCVKEASEHNYSVLIYYNSDREKLLETLRKGCAPIDGAIMMSPCLNDERLVQFESQHINFVVLGRPENSEHFNYVDVDNYSLVSVTARRLLFLTGWDEIYLVNSNDQMTISKDRYDGFAEVCKEYGLDAKERVIDRELFFSEEGAERVSHIVDKGNIIITCDDVVAERIYELADKKRLSIGGDISVFSLGRSLDSGTFDPPLSYAKQDYNLLGKEAVKMLLSLDEKSETKQSKLVLSKIIIGNSVKLNNL